MPIVGIYTHRRFQSELSIAADRCHPLHHQIQPIVEKKTSAKSYGMLYREKNYSALLFLKKSCVWQITD